MEHDTHHNETPVFWVVTAIVLVVAAIGIAIFSWFVYIGHEPYEPVHDENPHAQITTKAQTARA